MHTYAGLHAKLNAKGVEGYRATRELLDIASQAAGSPVYTASGLLRLAMSETNLRDYTLCAQKYTADVQLWTAEQCQKVIPALPPFSGIYIQSALAVHSERYLHGLWQACVSRGGHHRAIAIQALSELKEYDAVALCTGATAPHLLAAYNLPLTAVKGQILELEWPRDVPPLPIPLNTQAYLMMQPDNKSCIAGSTYEHHFANLLPQVDVAVREIMPKVAVMYPPLKDAKIIGCKAGVRASTPDHMPLLKQLDPRTWVLTGMGSKGLLYHALYAKELAAALSLS